VGGVDGDNHRLAGNQQRLCVGERAIVAPLPDQRGVKLAGGQRGKQRLGLVLDKRQVDLRVGAVECAD
jgi:hypothetical protein